MTDKGRHNNDPPPCLRRVILKDYKSIAACDVRLARLSVLVGPNGAGKSNIVDSLRFASDSLRNSLEYALRERGGLTEVRRRSRGHPATFGMRLEFSLPNGDEAVFAFAVGASREGGFAVQREVCSVKGSDYPYKRCAYEVRKGQLVNSTLDLRSTIEPDRLYLAAVSAVPEFRPLYDVLTRMGFYNLSPPRIRDLQDPDPGNVLTRDGSNIASVLKQLEGRPLIKQRIESFLETIAPGTKGFEYKAVGPKETVQFRQDVPGDENPWRFLALNMSDGTLRALGVLVALFQGAVKPGERVPLVGIEEPEMALHPAALAALADAMIEATSHTQVLVTSHSPDLLDNERIHSDSILAVVAEKGKTIVGTVDDAAREALKEGLYTPGELLRIQQIRPNASLFEAASRQLSLFAGEVNP